MWSWGANNYGQLGQGNSVNSLIPVQVKDSTGNGYLTNIKEISTATNMSIALDKDGIVYTWGLNDAGQLGNGTKTNKNLPIEVTDISNITKIEGGNKSSYAISSDGTVYAWGYNNNGQLGDGTKTTRTKPVKLENISGVIDISASSTDQVIILKDDETVWGWGYSNLGALTNVGGATPKQILGLDGSKMDDISSISMGYYAGASITNEGKVLSWGTNGFGGLGNGTTTNSSVPSYVKENADTELSNVFIASMGRNYSVYAKEDGTVWSVGYNAHGELGNTSTVDTKYPENISEDYITTDVLELVFNGLNDTKKINAKYIFGFNLYNYENTDGINYSSQDKSIAVVDTNGNVTPISTGKTYIDITSGDLSRRIEVNILEENEVAVMDIQAGLKHTIGLKTNGTLWSFGDNSYGQLGIGEISGKTYNEPQPVGAGPVSAQDIKIKFTKIAVGNNHTLALDTKGNVYSFGSNTNGQLGDGTNTNNGNVTKIEGLENIVKIIAYRNISMAIDKDGIAYVWGEGYTKLPTKISFHTKVIDMTGKFMLAETGTVWNMANPNQRVSGISNIVEISSGDSHNLSLAANGEVYAWGNNSYGQLGTGDTTNTNTPILVPLTTHHSPLTSNAIESIKAGQYNSYLLTREGALYSFGRNANNSLGTNTDENYIMVPTKIAENNVQRISAGQNYAVYVNDGGFVYSFGMNDKGQLGHGDKVTRKEPTLIGTVKVMTNEHVVTIEENDQYKLNVTLENTFNLRKDVIASDGFKFKTLDSNIATVTGDTVTGVKSGLTTIIAEHDQTSEVTNIYLEVLRPDTKSVIDVKAGEDFTIALKSDGTVWSWGLNDKGQLGLKDNKNYNEPQEIEMPGNTGNNNQDVVGETSGRPGERARQIAVGSSHSVILTSEGKVLTIGSNANGQLGNGTTTDSNTLVEVINDQGKVIDRIAEISAIGNATYLLDYDGNVWAFGEGYNKAAVKIENLEQIAQISDGYGITKDGEVYTLNSNGGVGATSGRPQKIDGLQNIIKISQGVNHTLFLEKDGTVYAMGTNTNGQCGIGTKVNCVVPTLVKNNVGTGNLNNIVDISAGNNFSMAVSEFGDVYTWGSNENNKLGTEQGADQILPKKNGNMPNGIIVSAGYNHAVCVNIQGRVYDWGNGENGTLGNGVNANSVLPVLVGSEEIVLDTNHLTIAKNDVKTLQASVKTFNLIKDLQPGDMTFTSNDKEIIKVDSVTGDVTGLKEGTASITVTQDGTDNIAIAQVSVIKEGTKIKPSVNTVNSTQVILKADGTVWTYGENANGELGIGNTTSSDNLTQVQFGVGADALKSAQGDTKIVEIAVGENHIVALDENGKVWTWGANTYYQLGTKGGTVTRPQMLSLPEKIVKISAGYNSTYAITEGNRLLSWGLNSNGQLGLGNYEDKLLPTQVQTMKNVLDVKAGKSHAIVILTDGTVWTTGNNSLGSLGGTEYKRNTFKPVFTSHDSTLTSQNIAYISAGEYHNLALTTNRKLYVWGYNVYGQLGIGNTTTMDTPTQITTIENVDQISAGKSHSVVVTKEGKIYVTGLNSLGQFGNGTTDNKTEFTLIENIDEIYTSAAGNTYTMAVKNNGTVWGWGDYYHGTSSNRTITNSTLPVQIGNEMFYLKENDIAVNKNGTKQINVNNASKFNVYTQANTSNNYTYTSLNTDVATVDINGEVTGIKVGTTWVKVVDNITKEEQVAIIRVVEEENKVAPKVAGGQNYAVVLKADGSIWSFGYNSNGELGNSTFAASKAPKEINILKSYTDIVTGSNYTLILRNDGTVWSVGDNQYGQLGLGNRTGVQTPTLVNSLKDVVKISARKKHSVALTAYGEVYVWGANENGELGTGNTDTLDTPTLISIPGVRIIDVVAGKNYTAFVTSDGYVYVSGTIAGIETQKPVKLERIEDVTKVAGGEELIVLTKEGKVIKAGETNTTLYASKDAVDIAAKDGNYMLLTNSGKLYVWGENSNGELGLGHTSNVDTPTLVEMDKTVISIGSGTNNTYFIEDTGRVYSSGLNTYGALGNETTDNSSEYVLVGKQEFKVTPDNVLMCPEDIVEFKVESERYNVLKEDLRETKDFNWVSNDTDVVTVEDIAKIKGIKEGETTITVTCNDTGKEMEIKVVVDPEASRIEKISVNKVDAKVSGIKKYEVTIATDDNTGELYIKTLDMADVISIDGGTTWTENGELTKTVDLPTKTTDIPFKVKTADGLESDYILTVIKQSNIAELEHLYVNGVEATAVSGTEYSVVLEDTDLAEIHAITKSLDAKVSIDNESDQIHEDTQEVSMKDTLIRTVPVIVTAESGKQVNYVLKIYRKSALTELESLTVNGIEATQNDFLNYSIVIDRDLTEVEVKGVTLYNTAKVNINSLGAEVKETSRTISITGETTTVKILVSAEGQEKEYTLTISKRPDTSGLAFVYVNGKEVQRKDDNTYETYVAVTSMEAEVLAIASVNTSIVQIGTNTAEIGKSTVKVSTTDLVNTYTIIVTDSDDSSKTASYTLIIKKPSTDNTLKEITISNSEMSVTATKVTGTNKYTAKINEKYENLTVTAVANYDLAQVAIDTNQYKEKQDTYDIVFNTDTYSLTIKVKAQDGTEAEYTLELEKLSSNTDLEYVKVEGVEAVPSQTLPNTYEITLNSKVENLSVNAKTQNENAEIAINNILYETHEITKQVNMDSKDVTVKINVKAEDGTLKTYDLIIHALPDNTKLKTITVDGITATLVPYTNTYQVRVPSALTQYSVTVTSDDSLAMVKFPNVGAGVASIGTNTETIARTGDLTTVNINIMAQDGVTNENYTLEITPMSTNTELSYVKLNGVIIDVSDDGEYHVSVANATTEVNIEALTKETLAKVGIDATGTTNKVTKVGTLTGDVTIFDIIVTAEDGTTTTTYKLNVEKMSADTSLFQVIVDGNVITQVDGKYIASIGNNTSAEVKAVTTHEKAVVTIDGNEEQVHENTETINTTDESKTIEITVKAEDGTISTHYLTLTRYSSDNTLLSISADGVDDDKITQTSENTYQMVVSNELTKLDLTAVTSKAVAKVKIGDNDYEVNTTTKEISIPNDTNTVTITVQAENGDEKEYTLTIIKKYVLTLVSIKVDGQNAVVDENGEYIAWIDPTATESQVEVNPTSNKVNVKVGSDISGTGVTTFTTQTPNEENTVKIKVSSPIDQDEVEYKLKIMKKSASTELEYVKVDGNVGTLEDDDITYTVKVPDKTGKYSMEVKTENRYAYVKIEDNEYSLETDTYEVDLTGVITKTVTVTVKSQTGVEKTYKVNIEKVSEDASIKIVKVNNVEITADGNGNYLAFVDDTLASVPLYIETTNDKAQIKLDDGGQNVHTVTENVTMDKDQINILVTVTAENGTTKICTVTIQKKSSDAEILSVKVDDKDAIQVDETTYYVTAKSGATEVTIKVKSANPYAEVQINGSAKAVGENTITYTLGADTKIAEVPIVITSQNGKVVNTYKLQIEQVSNDTSLEKVQVDGVDATYDVDSDVYRIIIDDSKDEAEVYAKTTNSEASVKIESGDLSKHEATQTVSTAADENNVTITVIAEDGTSVTKTLIIKKLSKDASIIKLWVNGNEIEPAEDGTYTASVLESIKTSAVKIKTTNSNASITINGTTGNTLGEFTENVDTSTGRKITVPIKITAEDTTVTKETTLTINMVSDIKTLEYLKVNNVEVTNYDEKTNTYKAFIPANSTSAKLDIKTISPYATINIDEQSATNVITYTATTDNDITYVYVTVIAEDDSTKTYTVILQKESTDVELKELYKDGVLVQPEEDENYIINVAEDTEEVTLKAIANSEYAKVQIDSYDAEIETTERKITLSEEKETTVTITVTAQNGDVKTYTAKIVKISANNEIQEVKVNSKVITKYDEITKTYIAFIPTDSTSADIEVKAKNSYATLEIGEDSSVGTINVTVDIEADENITDVLVKAETGDEDTFHIKLLKISTDNSIKEIYVDNLLITPDDDGNYIAEVLETNTSSLVKVIANNEYAMVQIEDNDPAEGKSEEKVILSHDRETKVKIKVTSQSGEPKEEILTIRKVSNNANINTVLVNDIEVKEYNAETKTYTAYIDEDDETAKVAVMTKSNYATIVLDKVSGIGTIETTVNTVEKTTKIEVTVKSETGTIEKYYIEIIKKSKDTSIELVKVNDIEVPLPYDVKIKKTDTKAKIYVRATSDKAMVKIADEDAELHESTVTLSIPLSQDVIVIPVVITAQDTAESKTYNITLRRASNNTDIKEILVNGETVDLTTFEHIVKNVNTSSIQVTTVNENAKVAIDTGTPTLNVANANVDTKLSTVRTITVTAEDGTQKEYSLTLIKKVTIEGCITDENIMNKHIAEIIVYQTADTRPEIDPDDVGAGPVSAHREIVAKIETNDDGTYEIVLEPGTYDVVFTKLGYLTHRITDIDITDGLGAELEAVNMLGGDFDKSGEIELDDLVGINDNYGTVTQKNQKFDLNGDGIINKLDRNIVKKNYGEKAQTIKWISSNPSTEITTFSLQNDVTSVGVNEINGRTMCAPTEETTIFTLPIASTYRISSEYGTRVHPITGETKTHHGIDIVGGHHTEILAVADGVVTFAGVQNGYGNCIEIKHTINGKTVYSFYAHLSKINTVTNNDSDNVGAVSMSAQLKPGDKVTKGTVIGLQGGGKEDPNPGTSTGEHLHFEIRTASGSGHSVDPRIYINF